jgi:hypothetical protein
MTRHLSLRGAGLIAVAAAMAAAPACTAGDGTPDLTGTWGHQRVFALEFVCPEVKADGSVENEECPDADVAAVAETTFPKYRPEFQAKVNELREKQVALDTVLRCYPPGVPRIGPPAKIVQNDREVVFLYDDQNGSFYRIIPIDGRPHRTDLSSSYLGDAIGHFEGDTLVVETMNFTDETWLTDNGAFHTKDLRVVERLRRMGNTIEYQATAYDSAVLAEPWVMRPRVLQRSPEELEEPPRCEERDLEQMVDPTQFHENPR